MEIQPPASFWVDNTHGGTIQGSCYAQKSAGIRIMADSCLDTGWGESTLCPFLLEPWNGSQHLAVKVSK